MSDLNVRSDAVDVEQIMDQIRARIREKRGADYTEAELQELATTNLRKFLDPKGVRSDLVEQFRHHHKPAEWPNYEFGETTLYESHRGFIRAMRKLLRPVLKLFFNPDPIVSALHVQSQLNTELLRQQERESLRYELVHNLVVELTRASIEVQNLKMRVESLSSRLDFDERRARALEHVVQYKPERRRPDAPQDDDEDDADGGARESGGGEGGGAESSEREGGERRRRRRRRRRRPGSTLAESGGGADTRNDDAGASAGAPEPSGEAPASTDTHAPPPRPAEPPRQDTGGDDTQNAPAESDRRKEEGGGPDDGAPTQ